MRILLAGDGHGAISVYNGLIKSNFFVDLCTSDEELIRQRNVDSKIYGTIDNWVNQNDGLVITAGYKPIIDTEILKKCNIINVHYSLLPKYRGLHSTVWAMLNGESKVGYTVHLMDGLVDNGDILYQEAIEVKDKTSWELMIIMDNLVEERIGKIILEYLSNRIIAIKQNFDDATFVGRRNKEDCKVDWNWSSDYFGKVLKALVSPYPRPYFTYNGKNYEIVKANVVHKKYIEIPGHIVYRDYESVWIKLGDGLLQLFDVYHDGRIVSALEVFNRTGIRL